ncbi:MAG: VOC family protein [Hominenteromicrobium sp.]
MRAVSNARFQCTLFAVQDVERSRKFYGELFNQHVVLDLGANVTFSGGFAIQQGFSWLTGIPENEIRAKSNNAELYFEVQDFDAFLALLASHPEVQLLHPPKTHEWKQRVVRLYDPDFHLIEVGESMAVIARRLLNEGLSVEETAAQIQHPAAFVQAAAENKI